MIEDILDECLREIQARRATVDDCLRKYPQHATELKPLLEMAVALAQVPDIKPSEAFKRAARQRLFDAQPNGKPQAGPDNTAPGADRSEPDGADTTSGQTSRFVSTAMPRLARD